MEFRELNEFKEFKQMVLQGERKQNKGGISTITIPAKYRSIPITTKKQNSVVIFRQTRNPLAQYNTPPINRNLSRWLQGTQENRPAAYLAYVRSDLSKCNAANAA